MSSDAVLDARFKRVLRWEPYAVLLLGWLACISVPLTLGRIGLSWDALNHHIYLGWVADRARFDQDYMAASLQAYQFPYLYWPVYKLAMMGVSGVTAGIVLATLHIVIVPPVWMAARILMPQQTLFGLFLRVAAVVLAFMTALVMRAFETTGNDLLAGRLWSRSRRWIAGTSRVQFLTCAILWPGPPSCRACSQACPSRSN